MELVSISELARRRGVAKATLARQVKDGLLPETCFVRDATKSRFPLVKLEEANKILDAVLDSAKVQEEKVKKLAKQSATNQSNPAKAKQKGEPQSPVGKNNNVNAGKADQKPKENANEPDPHADQSKQLLLDGLEFDEETGLYFADDVEVQDIEGKKIVTAKDALLSNAQRYQKHRALTESLKAQKLTMELEIEKGKLIDAEDLRKQIIKVSSETRDAIQNIPEQFGPDLLACQDLVELQTTLTHAINKALESLKRLKK